MWEYFYHLGFFLGMDFDIKNFYVGPVCSKVMSFLVAGVFVGVGELLVHQLGNESILGVGEF